MEHLHDELHKWQIRMCWINWQCNALCFQHSLSLSRGKNANHCWHWLSAVTEPIFPNNSHNNIWNSTMTPTHLRPTFYANAIRQRLCVVAAIYWYISFINLLGVALYTNQKYLFVWIAKIIGAKSAPHSIIHTYHTYVLRIIFEHFGRWMMVTVVAMVVAMAVAAAAMAPNFGSLRFFCTYRS